MESLKEIQNISNNELDNEHKKELESELKSNKTTQINKFEKEINNEPLKAGENYVNSKTKSSKRHRDSRRSRSNSSTCSTRSYRKRYYKRRSSSYSSSRSSSHSSRSYSRSSSMSSRSSYKRKRSRDRSLERKYKSSKTYKRSERRSISSERNKRSSSREHRRDKRSFGSSNRQSYINRRRNSSKRTWKHNYSNYKSRRSRSDSHSRTRYRSRSLSQNHRNYRSPVKSMRKVRSERVNDHNSVSNADHKEKHADNLNRINLRQIETRSDELKDKIFKNEDNVEVLTEPLKELGQNSQEELKLICNKDIMTCSDERKSEIINQRTSSRESSLSKSISSVNSFNKEGCGMRIKSPENERKSNVPIIDKVKKKMKKKKKDLRRSERIKTIVSNKILTRDLEITKKLKQNSQLALNENSKSNTLEELDHSNRLRITTRLSGEIDDMSLESKSISSPGSNFESITPFKKLIIDKVASNENLLQPGDVEGPNDYEKIMMNIYLTKKKSNQSKDTKRMTCDCSTSEQERVNGYPACGSDCLNRLLMIECGARCPCTEYCTNKRFQKMLYANVIPFRTEFKGWGVKALDDIKPDTFIIEYVGEVIGLKEFKRRCEKYAENNNEHFYFMALRNNLFIDATKKGNIARLFNHSCDPNCETQKWTVNGELRIGFFSRKPIAKGDEMTFDYQYMTFGEKQQKCYCGAQKCRGFLGTSINNSSTSNYLEHIWDVSDDEENSSSEEENSKMKSKERKRKKNNGDVDLEDQLANMTSLTNRESVVRLCRLMIRAESLENRILILNILENTKQDTCLKLFIDYYGLKLLWGWMVDVDRSNESIHMDFKIKILNILSIMPVKNRTVVEDSKVLSIVKRWSGDNFDQHVSFTNMPDSQNILTSNDKWIRNLIDYIIERVVKSSSPEMTPLNLKARELYTLWSNLEIAFKIPKRQRIEERKEHERELKSRVVVGQSSNSDYLIKNFEINSTVSNSKRDHDRKFNSSYYCKFNSSYKRNSSYDRSYSSSSNLSKEERRLRFEQMIKEKETASAKEKEPLTATVENKTTTIEKKPELSVISNNINAKISQWTFNTDICQWIKCPNDNNNQNQSSLQLISNPLKANTFSTDSSSSLNIISNLEFLKSVTMSLNETKEKSSSDSNTLYNDEKNINNYLNFHLPERNMNDLKQVLEKFNNSKDSIIDSESNLIGVPISIMDKKSENEEASPPPLLQTKSAKNKRKLPLNWKIAKNDKGKIYFYHKITKKSQWHFPTEDSGIERVKKDEKKHEKSPSSQIAISCSTATYPQAAQSPTDTLPAEFKKQKDILRDELSNLVRKLLTPYLKEDCKVGRIHSNEEFKYLARKFTHSILEKEISRAKTPDDLQFSKRVKIKTQDYIIKYMQKYTHTSTKIKVAK